MLKAKKKTFFLFFTKENIRLRKKIVNNIFLKRTRKAVRNIQKNFEFQEHNSNK